MNPNLGTALQDRYTIEREIGRGGMATVYLARDVRHNRHVALKVLNPELGAVLGVDHGNGDRHGDATDQTLDIVERRPSDADPLFRPRAFGVEADPGSLRRAK